MSHRHVHYEAAVEDYLRSVGRPYIAIDEAKRAVFAGAQVKSFDFLVYSRGPTNWLVDVKGRKLALNPRSSGGHLENWTTREDIVGLEQWARVFGGGFSGLLLFAYWLTAGHPPQAASAVEHEFGGRRYLLAAMPAALYARHMRDRSRRWRTVCVKAKVFRDLLRPLDDFL